MSRGYRAWFWLACLASLGLLVFGLSIGKASADKINSGLTTTPVTLGLNIKPGTTNSQTLKVYNNSSIPVPIEMEVKTFGAYGNSGEASITNFAKNAPDASYIRITPSSFTVQPGSWSSVTATISLPNTASLGYYYAVVFQPLINSQTKSTFTVKNANAILILVDTGSANEQKNVVVAKFSSSKGLYEYLPATFTVNLRNNGNIFLAPTGDIFISRHSNGTGTIASLPINPGGGNVLPSSNRVFSGSWSNGFPVFEDKYVHGQIVLDSKGNPVEQLKWNWSQVNKFRFGKYYAKLALIYNNGKQEVLLNSVVSFWVIPWKLLLVLLVFVLIILFGVWIIAKGLIKRIRRLSKKPKHQTPKS